MAEIKLRAWNRKENVMYERAFQKWFHVLLCRIERDSQGQEKAIPVKRASHSDCILMQSTTIYDRHGREIFEGDRVTVSYQGQTAFLTVGEVPDMYRSRRLHPLHSVLSSLGITSDDDFEIEVTGNEYEDPI